MNNISNNEKLKMIACGEIERYCITKLTEQLNKSTKYNYQLLVSESWLPIGYDAIIYVKDKLTDDIKEMYLVEVKVRNVNFNELIFEQKKLNTLKRERNNFVKNQGPTLTPKIIYIQFTNDGTYMFFIDDLINENLMPQVTTMKMNKMTVADNNEKINKKIYLLSKDLAVKKNFVFNDIEYATTLLNKSIELTKEANTIVKKYHSIF